MNNTFSFNRFKSLLLKDGKMYFRNFGTSLIAFCCMTAILWILTLLFGGSAEGVSRFCIIAASAIFAMMMVPEKVFGKVNISREGVSFAMLPASSLEKFLSMFLYCAIVTPVIVFFGGYLIDTLLSLFPFGGFEKPIHLYTFNELARMMNDTEGAVQAGHYITSDVTYTDILPIGVMRTSFYVGIIQWAAIFMLGNMLFKKHKTGKTFASALGIGFVAAVVLGSVLLSSGALERWVTKVGYLPVEGQIHVFHNVLAWGMVMGIIITILLLFFTYRKIKTQKY